MSNSKKEKKLLIDIEDDFNIKNQQKTNELDFLLDKKESSNQKLNIEIKLKPKRTERLQTYITSQLKKEIEVFKLRNGIKTDSEAIEILLRAVLGLDQI